MANLKQIEGFMDYLISDTGYVISRKIDPSGKIMKFGHKPTPKGDKYRYVNLCSNNCMYPRTIHRLVALAFVPNPDSKPEVNHKDGNKLNNHYTNLEWVTRKENAEHASLNGFYQMGEDKCDSKLKNADIIAIRQMHSAGISIAKISKNYPVKYKVVLDIVHRRKWKHIA
jgi:hypothetical protein